MTPPNVHGLLPADLARAIDCDLTHARSLLAHALAFHPAHKPKRSAVPAPVRARFLALDHQGLEVVDRGGANLIEPRHGMRRFSRAAGSKGARSHPRL